MAMTGNAASEDSPGRSVVRPRLPGPVVEGDGRTRIEVVLQDQGRDLIARISGGRTHVGAVAVFAPRTDDRVQADDAPGGPVGPRTGLPGIAQDHADLVVVPGHKEGPLAAEAAASLGRASGRICVAIAGIHQDNATKEEIAAIVANVQKAVARLAADLHRLRTTGAS